MSARAISERARAALLSGWYSPSVLAELRLPGLPTTRERMSHAADRLRWRAPDTEYPANEYGLWRKRQGRGGGFEYRAALLPPNAHHEVRLLELWVRQPPGTPFDRDALVFQLLTASYQEASERTRARFRALLESEAGPFPAVEPPPPPCLGSGAQSRWLVAAGLLAATLAVLLAAGAP